MNWRVYQRIFELVAVGMMMVGIVLMWMRKDPEHYFVYIGFLSLTTGKLIETLNVNDPQFKILKLAACVCLYLLLILNLFYHVQSILYILIPLGAYYAFHYRLMFHQRKT